MHRILLPQGWPRPKGYANGVAARGTLVSVAGQIGWTPEGVFETDDFVGQCSQALRNVMAVLREAGAGPEHIVRMTWYLTSRDEYVNAGPALGAVYRELMTGADGRVAFPAMTAVQVTKLIEERAKVEIEVTAVVPD